MTTAPNWVIGALVAAVVMTLAIGGLAIVRRFVSADTLRTNHDVAAAIFPVVGTMYAVLLALVVVTVWQQYQSASATIDHEAAQAGDLYRDAGELSEPARTGIRDALREYAETVVREEWPAMARGGQSEHAWAAFDRLWAIFRATPVDDFKQLALRTEMLHRLNTLGDDRRLRLLHSQSHVHPALWLALTVGGVISVGFSYLFAAPRRVNVLMTTMFAASIAVIFFVIVVIDEPFNGYGRIEPAAFARNIAHWPRIHE